MKNKDILVGIDFSPASKAALKEAGHIANQRQAWLHLVHVIDSEFFERELDEKFLTPDTLCAQAENALRKFCYDALDFPPSLNFIVVVGHPVEELEKQAKNLNCELLVLGSNGNETSEDRVGTSALSFVRHSKHPVLLIKKESQGKFRNIVVGYDFSETADRALAYAVESAKFHQAKLHIAHVEVETNYEYIWSSGPEISMMPAQYYETHRNEMQTKLGNMAHAIKRNNPGLEVDFAFLTGASPSNEICRFVDELEADLTIVGTRGRTGLKRLFLGTTAEKIIHRCPSSVLLVKPEQSTKLKNILLKEHEPKTNQKYEPTYH